MALKSTTNLLKSAIPTILYTCPVGVDASAHGIVFGNLTGVDQTVNLFLYKSTTALNSIIGENLTVPAYNVLSWPRPLNMQSGDYITASVGNDETVEATVSIFETKTVITNLNFKGEWSSTSSYYGNDVVYYNGASYVALGYSLNSTPDTNPAVWALWVAGNVNGFSFAEAPPTDPVPGYRWVNSATGIQYTYVVDADSGQWIDLTTPVSPPIQIINTDGNPGRTLYVGSIDPALNYQLEAGDVWIQV